MDLSRDIPARDTPESIAFGRYRVLAHRRELFADDAPIRLGGRAFDLLMVLIESPGAIVSKDDLMARVWPDRVVAENNLQTQILALRRAFGAERDLIRTVAGRGYQFTGAIRIISAGRDEHVAAGPLAAADDAVAGPTNLPQPVSELIGREAEVEEVSRLVRAGRLVTLAGAGGIGKTRLALAVARRLLPQFPDGVWLVQLSPLSDPRLVPAVVAEAVGLELPGGEISAERVAQALVGRRLLIVLDTCEHVIDAAALTAEAVLRTGSAIQIIATSREPLRAEGEQLYPVQPLAVPTEGEGEPLKYGAVRLFIERALEAGANLALDPPLTRTISEICRRLDGIPLAIEMAAARVTSLGVGGLADRLDDRFQLLTGGRRTALPRHQTLRAMLDWSHDLLAEPERILLRRLAVFAGAFSLEAAGAVVASAEIVSSEVVDGISNLVAKSLIVAEVDAAVPRYRLLDTLRAYALEKLAESNERERVARRHAEYYRDLFERAEAELQIRPTAEWLGDYGRQIDNLRVALDWAFSSDSDVEIGVALTAAAAPLWFLLSRLEECRGRVERALAGLGVGADGDSRREMKLCVALGASLFFASDTRLTAIGAAWTRALEIAERLDDVDYQLRSLLGLWNFNWGRCGRQTTALRFAQKFHALAGSRSDSNDRLVGERLIGVSQLYLGELQCARHNLDHMLAHHVQPVRESHIIRFQGDQRLSASLFLCRVLWLQGFPDRAIHTAETCVTDARASNHVISLCDILAHGACPVALWTGDLRLAERHVGLLDDISTRYSLARWRAMARSYQGVLAVKRGDLADGTQLLLSGFEELGQVSASFRSSVFLCEVTEALIRVGRIGEALSALEVESRVDEAETRWGIAELLRLKGELLLSQDAPGAVAEAEDRFRRALDLARRQGALSWELRAATSFARLLRDQGRSADAKGVLQPVYDRFTEGFETADLTAAKVLLRDLR
jgi:predicted ATPase/DNA-binding winged helix-turn-helix (wHTH) protein